MKDTDFYDCCDEAESLSHTDPDEAIEAYLDSVLSPKCDTLAVLRDAYGETVKVYGFKRRVMDEWALDHESILEDVLERLDEEYGGEDPTEPTESMKAAAVAFVEAIRTDYTVWQCERNGEEIEANIEAWVREHCPDWLEGAK